MKFFPKHWKFGPYPPHPTKNYTCGVTNAPKMCSGIVT